MRGLTAAQIVLNVLRDFRRFVAQLLGFEILFKIISFGILGPLSAWAFRVLISSTGRLSITNEQILSFLISPIGIMGLVLWGAMIVVTLFSEQAGFMTIASRTFSGQRITSPGALWITIKRMPALLGLGILQFAIYALFLVPFVALTGLTYVVLLSGYNINYLLAERPPVFWVAVTIAAILLLGLLLLYGILYLRWIFSLPACLFEGKGFSAALKSSHLLGKGSLLRSAGVLLGWAVLMVALAVIIVVPLDFLSGMVLGALGENLRAVSIVIAGLVALILLILEALFFFGFTIHCLLITHLYHDIRSRRGMPLPEHAPSVREVNRMVRTKGGLTRLAPWAIGTLVLFITAVISYFQIETLNLKDQVQTTAHRGSSRRAPENTISAVRKAIEDGADFAEIDVQETADGVIVLLHDEDLKRVAGVNKKIWQTTYAGLKDLDAGSWFSPEFEGERIPTLDQVIEVARDRIKLNIELKFSGHERSLVERVVEIVRDEAFESQCIISSLNYTGLLKARGLNERLRLGYIIVKAFGDISRLDVDFLSVKSDLVTRDLIESARKRNKEVHVWTVNDSRKMSSLIDLGVNNIITDAPDVLVAVLGERATLNDVERILLRFRVWLGREGGKTTVWRILRSSLKTLLPMQSPP